MKRFICEQNIANFERLLAETSDPVLQRTLKGLLATNRRELALLEAESQGAEATPVLPHRKRSADAPERVRKPFLSDFDASPHPYMLLDPGPGLVIVDVNHAYAKATFIDRESVIGRSLFEVFPDNPADPAADGVSNLYTSLRKAAETGRSHAMAVQRYDIRDADGAFLERHWQPINSPIHDEEGRLIFLLHHVEDVTSQVVR